MNFSDQMSADLEKVFFSDHKHKVSIGGVPVSGFLNRSPHGFDNMNGSTYIFEAPRHLMPVIKKNDQVIRLSDNRSFTVKDIDRENDIVRLYL